VFSRVLVGIEGSEESREAARQAALLVDGDRESADEPVAALVAAAADTDLLVVGSRGLHGLKALGSVSERVAHQAHSSVLWSPIRLGCPAARNQRRSSR
jgi:nucleotide-binding universal stress UspA family protein